MFCYYNWYFGEFVYFFFLLYGFKVSKGLLHFLFSDITGIKAELPISIWTILMYDCSFCFPFYFVFMFGKKKHATLMKAVALKFCCACYFIRTGQFKEERVGLGVCT